MNLKRKSLGVAFGVIAGLLASCAQGTGTKSSLLSPSADSSAEASSTVQSSLINSSSPSAPAVVLSPKTIDFYLFQKAGKIAYPFYFEAADPDIPYLDLGSLVDLFGTVLKGTFATANCAIQTTWNGKTATLSRENGSTVTIDFLNKTVTFYDFGGFFIRGQMITDLDVVSTSPNWLSEAGASRYIKRTAGFQVKGHAVTMDLGAHGIPMIYSDGKGYLPCQTLCDLFFTPIAIQFLYNGTSAFLIGGGNLGDMDDLFYAPEAKARSQGLSQFNYDELTLLLDYYYGLKDEHDVSSFDAYFKANGLDKALLNTDGAVADNALYDLCNVYFADWHSSFTAPSAYAGRSAAIKGTMTSPYVDHDSVVGNAWRSARKTAFASGVPGYQEVGGDTAFVTFDQFKPLSQDYYTTPATETTYEADTFGLVEYAHSQIFKTGSTIKNVVLDLSCNLGGAADAAAYVDGWFLDDAYFPIMNPLSGEKAQTGYASDVNLDGVFDAKDRVSGLNLYCLISPLSFSCGNLIPHMFKESKKVTLIGQTTGGGACVVESCATADGSRMNVSGVSKIATVKNGIYYSVDHGVDPDISIDRPSQYYDRAYVRSLFAD